MIVSLLINLIFWLADTIAFIKDIFAIIFGDVRYN